MNYFEFHIGDWAAATEHLSDEEELVYFRLVRAYYRDERPIPSDPRQVYRLTRARTDAMREAVDVVLKEFFQASEDGWHHVRCDRVIADYHAFVEKQRENGRKGGRRPNASGGQPTVNPPVSTAEAVGSEAKPNANPPTSHFPLPTNQSLSIERERASGRERKSAKTPRERASKRVPESFDVTPELRSWAADHVPGMDVDRETRSMRDYEFRRPYTDWPAVWRRWMTRAYETHGANGNGRRKTRYEEADDALERWREERRRQSGGLLERDEGAVRLALDGHTRSASVAAVGTGDLVDDAGGGEARAALAADEREGAPPDVA